MSCPTVAPDPFAAYALSAEGGAQCAAILFARRPPPFREEFDVGWLRGVSEGGRYSRRRSPAHAIAR
eukprot:255363-Lingulodinium_polyedra.AAC.1